MTTAELEFDNFVVLPESIEVSGYEVSVRPATPLETSTLEIDGVYQGGEIVLAIGGNPQRIAETFVHETLHAILDHSALRLENEDVEERFVTQISMGLTTLLAKDKAFVDFIRRAYEGNHVVTQWECGDTIAIISNSPALNKRRGNIKK